MPNTPNSKLKLLYVKDILEEQTDPDHPLSASQIGEILQQTYGLSMERKSVTPILHALSEYYRSTGSEFTITTTRRGSYVSAGDGPLCTVTLECDPDLLPKLRKSFGPFRAGSGEEKFISRPSQKHPGRVETEIRVFVTNVFFGRLTGIGPQIRILAPQEVREKYTAFLQEELLNYLM